MKKKSGSKSRAPSSLPVGIFDSGVGGLTVAREIMKQLPREDIIYFGDTARVPYGSKSPETVRRYSAQIADFLTARRVKAIVVACNTASALALKHLKSRCSVPVVGVIEPACRRAAEISSGKKIGVIGTEATVRSRAYPLALEKIVRGASVSARACPLLVPLVEEGRLSGPIAAAVLREYLKDMLSSGIDTLILGCTHYPMLIPAIRKIVGRKVAVVDSASAAAEELSRVLTARGLLRKSVGRNKTGRRRFYVSDSPSHFAALGRKFLKNRFTGAVQKVEP